MATYSCFWRVPRSKNLLQASLRRTSDLLTLVSYYSICEMIYASVERDGDYIGYCQVIVGKSFIQISYRTASVRYAAKTRCVSYSLHSLIHSGSCANSPCWLRHAPAFVDRAQLPTEASLSSVLAYHHPSQ